MIVATVGLLALMPMQGLAGIDSSDVKWFEGSKRGAEKGDPGSQFSLGY